MTGILDQGLLTCFLFLPLMGRIPYSNGCRASKTSSARIRLRLEDLRERESYEDTRDYFETVGASSYDTPRLTEINPQTDSKDEKGPLLKN